MERSEKESTNYLGKAHPDQVSPNSEKVLLHAEAKLKNAHTEFIVKKINIIRESFQGIKDTMELENNKNALRQLFVDADNIVKENIASINRFCEIIKENKKHCRLLRKEITAKQEEILEGKQLQELMKNSVKDYSIFVQFLEDVRGVNVEYDRDVLSRYETLEMTRADLIKVLEKELQESSDMKQQMLNITNDKDEELKSLGNRVVEIQMLQKEIMTKRRYWEYMVQLIKAKIFLGQQNMIELKDGCNDLYRLMCFQQKQLPLELDIEKQLDYICKTIMFYKEVVAVASSLAENKEKNKSMAISD